MKRRLDVFSRHPLKTPFQDTLSRRSLDAFKTLFQDASYIRSRRRFKTLPTFHQDVFSRRSLYTIKTLSQDTTYVSQHVFSRHVINRNIYHAYPLEIILKKNCQVLIRYSSINTHKALRSQSMIRNLLRIP